jgi:formate hydrogenlyase subunit 3/multisubunit Na+/H+ antiporter MnhD subunit
MSDFLTSHWLILNILVPLTSVCFIAISNSAVISRGIFISIAPILLGLAIFTPTTDASYALGDWPAPIGIEYIL